ncbi:MAG: hypothetical protein R3F30_07345 [Planctomycetota bacterium]
MRATTITTALLALSACVAARVVSESGSLQVSATGVQSTRSVLGHVVQAGTISVRAGSTRLCDVTIDLVHDTNGNGVVGDAGDSAEVLHSSLGEFRSWERRSFQVDLPKDSPKAWLRVRGWPCPAPKVKDGPAPVISAFEVRADGLLPLSDREPGLTLRLGAEAARPHCLTLARNPAANALGLRVDDLRQVGGELWSAYGPDGRQPGGAGRPDCLGALVFVDAVVLPIAAGQAIRLPYRPGSIGTLRVVSFDRAFRPVGDWTLTGLSF